MRRMRPFFYWLALVGFALSALVHLATFVGVNPQGIFPGVWVLHLGIFLVWVPAIFGAEKLGKWPTRGKLWGFLVEKGPRWMQVLCVILAVNAVFNFLFTGCVLNEGGGPGRIDGRPVLHHGGEVIRELTEEEFEKHQAYVVRVFSAIWLVFYLSAAMLLRARVQADLEQKREQEAERS